MTFVKLDCGILTSTLWFHRECREIFITALLMAEPFEALEPVPQIEVGTLTLTDFIAPPGWYGMVPAAGVGIIRQAGLSHEAGMAALVQLGSPDPESRSQEFEGRRLIRVNGGYLILNYSKYREKDHTTAERSKRYREKKKNEQSSRRGGVAPRRDDVTPSRSRHSTPRDITQAEEEIKASLRSLPKALDQEEKKYDYEPEAV